MDARQGKYLTLYRLGFTLEEIGKHDGITRERVRQVLSGIEEYREEREKKKVAHIVKCTCRLCGAEFMKYVSNGMPPPQFCNQKCYYLWKIRETDQQKNQRRKCTRCGKVQGPDRFYGRYGGKAGSVYCKSCHAYFTKSWQRRNPDRARAIQRRATENYWRKKLGLPKI